MKGKKAKKKRSLSKGISDGSPDKEGTIEALEHEETTQVESAKATERAMVWTFLFLISMTSVTMHRVGNQEADNDNR